MFLKEGQARKVGDVEDSQVHRLVTLSFSDFEMGLLTSPDSYEGRGDHIHTWLSFPAVMCWIGAGMIATALCCAVSPGGTVSAEAGEAGRPKCAVG